MKEDSGVTSASPPAPEAGVAVNLLEEIRARIWSNTGCSDDAAEQAAAAVYDLFLDQPSDAPDLLEALKAAPYPSSMGTAQEHYERFYTWLKTVADPAIAKAEGRS